MGTMDFLKDELADLKAKSLYRPLRVLGSPQLPTSIIDGKKVINLSSNNYLGLTNHPRIMKAAKEAIDKWGFGAGAVRPIIGTMQIHIELEEKLARFKHTEASLVFPAGIAANRGTIQAILTSEDDCAISDELNHASIIDGVRLSKAKRKIYPHSDMVALEKALKEAQGSRRIMIITDGVFSMDGDIADLPNIVRLAEQYGAMVFVDDAHGSGVMGKNGRGTTYHYNLQDRIHIQMATLSKAIGCMGGYIAGSRDLIDYLIHRARPFLFSTAHPPATVAACITALEILEEETWRHEKLWANTRFFKSALKELGFNTGNSVTPITPVIVGEAALAMRLSDRLFEEGVFAQGVGYPTVPEGKARVRTIVTATHTEEELKKALDAFEKVGKELKLIK